MLSLHEDDKELLKVASVITEAAETSEILESAMADLMEEDNVMMLSELECPTTDEEKLLKMALHDLRSVRLVHELRMLLQGQTECANFGRRSMA